MILALKLSAALVALILPGEALLRCFTPGMGWGWCRPLVAFGIGQTVAMWALWWLGMAGVPMWDWGIGIVLTTSGVGLWWFWRQERRDLIIECIAPPVASHGGGRDTGRWVQLGIIARKALPWMILALAGWILAVEALEEALRFRIGCVPGMGNWDFKTKLLIISNEWPANYFEYEAHNRRLGYPPGFPLLCGWCAAFMGGLDTHAIRLLPAILTMATFLLAGGDMIRLRRWWGLPALGGLLGLLLGYPGRGVISQFYAEPLLMFTAAVTVVVLARIGDHPGRIIIGFLAAGSMAWVKNEGIVAFILMAGAVFVFAKREGASRKSIALSALCIGIPTIVPWRVYLSIHGWIDESFAFAMLLDQGRWARLLGAWNEYSTAMFSKGERLGGAWWILPILGWFCFQPKRMLPPVLVLTAVGLAVVAVLMMVGSAEEDFGWHLNAAPRVLLCPSLLLLMAYSYIGPYYEKRNERP